MCCYLVQVAKNWAKLMKRNTVGIKTDYGIKHFNACEIIISAVRVKRFRKHIGTRPGQFDTAVATGVAHGTAHAGRGANISRLMSLKSKSKASMDGSGESSRALLVALPAAVGAAGAAGGESKGLHHRVAPAASRESSASGVEEEVVPVLDQQHVDLLAHAEEVLRGRGV